MSHHFDRRGRRARVLASAVSGVLSLAAAGTATAGDAADLDEIVVTGSLIVRDGFEAPTPVTVLSTEDIERSANVNFGDYAAKVPTLATSVGSHSTGALTGDGTAGANNLNLRGLNANRTLVLLDGMRVGATNVVGRVNNGGAVDINVFPDALIKRVDVVTGGATATYGSGALAGAVNFVLDTNFTGVKFALTGGITTYGDDAQSSVSLTGGTRFADGRGHVMASVSQARTAGIEDGYSRSWLANFGCRMSNPAFTPSNGQPFFIVRAGCISNTFANGGVVTGGPLRGLTFGANGSPQQFNYGTLFDAARTVGGNPAQSTSGPLIAVWGPESALDVELKRQNFFGRASFDLTERVTAYAQVILSTTQTHGAVRENIGTGTILSGNPFIPATVQAQMTAQGIASFPIGKYFTDIPPVDTENGRKFSNVTAGLKGRFGETWSYDLGVTQSYSPNRNRTHHAFVRANLTKALDAVVGPNGQIVCRAALTNPADPCLPFNILGTGVASAGAIEYITNGGTQWLDQNIKMQDAKAVVTGAPFATWAGPVSLAIGAEYQRNTASGVADPIAAAGGYSITNYTVVRGKYSVAEAYGETVIPLAKDAAWAKAWDFNAGVRFNDFSTSGNVWAWKFGTTLRPIDDLLIRATRSRDTRPPNMGEFFQTLTTAGVGLSIVNPWLNNSTVSYTRQTSGNAKLGPEEADTLGLGLVYRPSWLPGFTASLDYYDIKVKGAIVTLTAQQTVFNCFAGQTEYCDAVNQDAAHTIASVVERPSNTAGARQRGYDLEVGYSHPLAGGTIGVRGLVTHINEQYTVGPDGFVTPGNLATWRYSLGLTYGTERFSAGLTGRGFNDGKIDALITECTSGCPAAVAPRLTSDINTVPGLFMLDADLTFHLGETTKYDAFVSVDNVLNKNPNYVWVAAAQTGIGAFLNLPNPLGRLYRGGVRVRF